MDIKHWDLKDGLLQRQVNYVYQDRQGFIWASSPMGLSRYDGYHFTHYTEDVNAALTNVTHLAEDMDGDIWYKQENNSNDIDWYSFNPLTLKVTSLQQIISAVMPRMADIFTMADSSILISTVDRNTYYTWRRNKGLHKWVIPAQYFVVCELPEKNSILAEDGDSMLAQIDVKGRIVKQTKVPFVKGSASVKRFNGHIYLEDTASKNVFSISPDVEVASENRLQPPFGSYVSWFIFDVGNEGVICRNGKLLKPDTREELLDFKKINMPVFGTTIMTGFTDNMGRTWIANEFGLYRITAGRNKFHGYYTDTPQTSYNNTCRGITRLNGNIYVCSEYGCMHHINIASNEVKYLACGFDYGLIKTDDGFLTGDVDHVDTNGVVFHSVTHSGSVSWSFMEYTRGVYLMGNDAGLWWYNKAAATVTPFTGYNGLSTLKKSTVLHIARDNSGNIWACASNGLYLLDIAHGVIARYSSIDTGSHYLPATSFRHFIQDAAGIYWLATTNGLIAWNRNKNTFHHYSQADGFSNNSIYAVYEDNYNNLWMSSDYGIMKMNKATGAVRTYTTDDGITCNEFNRASHYKDDSGNIYFGSLRGLNTFNPRDFTTGSDAVNGSPLVITSFLQFNGKTNKLEDKRRELLGSNRIIMYPEDLFLTLEFSLLNYNNSTQTTYYWRVDGVDTGWNMQKDRTLRVSRLPYDTHLLRIKAQGADGTWSRNQLLIYINVVRPFYLRPWFLLVCIAMLALLVVAGYRWRLYLLRRENELLDITVREKTHDLLLSLQQKEVLLKEIHHRVKNNLQVISSLLRLQSRSIQDEQARNMLLEAQNRVLSIALIHQKLYQNDYIDGVEFGSFAGDLFTQLRAVLGQGSTVTFINDIRDIFLNIDTAVPLGLILNELVTNSFKYAFKNAEAPCIWLSITRDNAEMTLIYSDNGPGLPDEIDMERVQSLGLRLVVRLSKQLGGSASYVYNGKSSFIVRFSNK